MEGKQTPVFIHLRDVMEMLCNWQYGCFCLRMNLRYWSGSQAMAGIIRYIAWLLKRFMWVRDFSVRLKLKLIDLLMGTCCADETQWSLQNHDCIISSLNNSIFIKLKPGDTQFENFWNISYNFSIQKPLRNGQENKIELRSASIFLKCLLHVFFVYICKIDRY